MDMYYHAWKVVFIDVQRIIFSPNLEDQYHQSCFLFLTCFSYFDGLI